MFGVGPLRWLLLHPLLLGTLAGFALGDAAIGFIAAVALTPVLSESDEPEVMAGATLAAVPAALGLSAARGAGGILVESWVGALMGLGGAGLALLLVRGTALAGWARRVIGFLVAAVLTWVLAHVVHWPEALWGAAPWLAGGAFVFGLGRLAALPVPSRAVVTVVALLAGNYVGQGAVLVLGLGLLLPRTLKPTPLPVQVGWVAVVLIAASVLAWIPYQLPSWDQPAIQLGERRVPVLVPRWALLAPLLALGWTVGRLRGPLRE